MTDKVCVIGLGYVGLPLAVAFAEKMPVVGFDINQERINELDVGHDRTLEIEDELLSQAKDNLLYTSNIKETEDCPDMRNTKVVDIIEELKDYGINVDVYDPWVNTEEKKKYYHHGIIANPLENGKKYDSIVVAVAHQQFKEFTSDDYKNLSKDEPVVIDIKNIVKNPSWRL